MENLKNIIKEGLKNGGFTIDSFYQSIKAKNGYMVSLANSEQTFDINTDLNILEKAITEYQAKIANKRNYYIGLWVDDNLIYLDISKHYTSKNQAVKVGIDNEQLAIYDIKNQSSIYLTKNVYIIYSYNKRNNDIKYIQEFDTLSDVNKAFNIKNASMYTTNNIDNINHLINDKYFIFKDNVLINER